MRASAALEEIGWLALVAFMFPLAILLLGTPIALAFRLLLEIVQRW